MGCDIHAYVEKLDESGKYQAIEGVMPFDSRCYGTFGFLAGVRNYSGVTPIAGRRGIPADISDYVREEYAGWDCDAHSASWLSVAELSDFNYDAEMEDRRVTRQVSANCWDGGATAEPGGGRAMTYREFLGDSFFQDIEELKSVGACRVVFWFDN